MSDVDYVVIVNEKTSCKHLALVEGATSTVCGLRFDKVKLFSWGNPVRSFWRNKNRCHNCVRAAKR